MKSILNNNNMKITMIAGVYFADFIVGGRHHVATAGDIIALHNEVALRRRELEAMEAVC